MERGVEIHYQVDGNRVHPSNRFYRMLLHQPADVRNSTEIRRLGLLTEQLLPYEERVTIDISNPPVSNDRISIWPCTDGARPKPPEVAEREQLIEQNVLGEDDRLIINHREFDRSVQKSVLWLLSELKGRFSDRRNIAIETYCEETGLTGLPKEQDKRNVEYDDPWSKSSAQSIDLTDVSKL